MGLLMSMISAAGTLLRPPSSSIVLTDYAKAKAQQDPVMQYALDTKLPSLEVLFEDVEGGSRRWTRRDFIRLVGNFGVPNEMTNFYVDRINKRSLAVDGHLKKVIFRTNFAEIVIREADRKTDYGTCLIRVREHLSSIHYLAEGKIDATKCKLWCIPLTYKKHASAIVVNVKEGCFEYVDSGPADSRKTLGRMKVMCRRIAKVAVMYINSTLQDDDDEKIDSSKFNWKARRVPRQPSGSAACAVYRLRFLEEWNGGGREDLWRFDGWDDKSWHQKERVKICASILNDHDSNAILHQVKQRAATAREKNICRRRRRMFVYTMTSFGALYCFVIFTRYSKSSESESQNP